MRDDTEVPFLIEGYASLFGTPDRVGDVVRPGAFSASLARRPIVPMLIQHNDGAKAGRWMRITEDGRGLCVRGLVNTGSARRLISMGLDGLSIGFRPVLWVPRTGGGRELRVIDLVEISIVSDPMLAGARFTVGRRTMEFAA
ncbi:HK97 family phage prohead protease [Hyphomonas sp.]|uniref:HK97 family phage prohead protease n=1 Tax=Hyphomonas sp. TaxID=87 RepID=UPI00391955E2